MPSLIDLDTNLLVYIAARCDLESAGYLSLVNKQVWGAVAPVLPALTDVRALRLLLPFQECNSGRLFIARPQHDVTVVGVILCDAGRIQCLHRGL